MDAEASVRFIPVQCAPKKAPCPCCGKMGRRQRTRTRQVRSIAYKKIVILEITYGESAAGCGCCKYFRTQPEDVLPKAKYDNKVRQAVLDGILNNRFYVGEIRRGSNYYQGRHQPLIDRAMFQLCQDILCGKNRRATPQVNMPLSGGLITGERIKRKLNGGGVRVHEYYRCANNTPDASHPTVRWRCEDLEEAIIADLETLRIPEDDLAEWFRTSVQSALRQTGDVQREQRLALKKRAAEIESMQDRLLTAYLAGTIDESTLAAKQTQLRDEAAQAAATLATLGDFDPSDAQVALSVFEFAQNAAEIWRGSKMLQKREILESLSLNRLLGDVTLVLEKRKPFDELAKRLEIQLSRDDAHRFEQMETLATTCVRAYPADRPPQLRFLARLANGGSEE